MKSDSIRIDKLPLEAVIGVHDWEQQVSQSLVLDLEFNVDVRTAAASDSLQDAVDYQAVAETIGRFASNSRFRLVETLAESIASLLLERFAISHLRLRLTKPGAMPGNTMVSVSVERAREPQS